MISEVHRDDDAEEARELAHDATLATGRRFEHRFAARLTTSRISGETRCEAAGFVRSIRLVGRARRLSYERSRS